MPTKNRQTLKSFFVKNAIPTASNFADLLDSQLNQQDDGVFKTASEPLAVVAAPGAQAHVLRFLAAPNAQHPDWQVSLKPQGPNAPEPGAGLGVSDALGNVRLFIDKTTGNLGVGTNKPAAPLTVRVDGAPDLLVRGANTFNPGVTHLTLGAADDQPLTITNPQIPWLTADKRATLRFGTSTQGFYEVGVRDGNALRFTVGPNAEELMTLTNSQVDPSVTIHSTLKVNGGVYTNVVDTTNLKVQDSLTTPRAIIGTTPRTGLRLDADQWVELPAMNNQIPFNTGVTIQAWVYMFTASQPARILECLGVNNENSIIFGFEDGLLAAGVVNGLEPDVKAAFLFPTLAWTHVAVVIATTGAVKFYVNGTWVPTQPVNMNMNVKTAPPQARARKPNTVGKTSSNPGTAFSGLIRELSVWTGEAPIHSAVDPVIKPDATGLVGHWRMATGNMSNTCTNQPLLGSATLKSKDGQPLAGWAPGHDRTQGAGTSIMQDGWIPLTIPNASKWSAVTGLMNPPVSYYKDSLGIVHFRGFLLAMSPTQEEVLVQLPPGYRPEFTSLQVVHHNKNGCVGVFVGADGKITIPASTSAAFISLDSICFRAYP